MEFQKELQLRLEFNHAPETNARDLNVRKLSSSDKTTFLKIPIEILIEISIICRDDDNSTYSKSILSSRHAPLLLCRIFSTWRTVALNIPRLWDTLFLPTEALVSTVKMPAIRTLFGLSQNLPLSVTIGTSLLYPAVRNNSEFLHRIWEFHHRLEYLHIDISSYDVPLGSIPPPTTLSLLQSLHIQLREESTRPALPKVLALFRNAPTLQILGLQSSFRTSLISHVFTPDFFPWHQLTTLTSFVPITTTTARNILRQCRALRTCDLSDIEPSDVRQQAPTCILDQMRSLTLCTTDDLPFSGFFESLAFPNLEVLLLQLFMVPAHSFLALQERSQFQLKDLKIHFCTLTPEEIVYLLRLQPQLELLNLTQCDASGELFKAFTYRGGAVSCSSLALLHLTEVEFEEEYRHGNAIPGNAAADMVESLLQYRGSASPFFPSLSHLHLRLSGAQLFLEVPEFLLIASLFIL
ncbi:hypothetical protein B0H19DRAFT_1245485 [Mycena capillaripes]|nr:hypothetical protein B0H19DRAFT_1245485 [Mycena capillaripes]